MERLNVVEQTRGGDSSRPFSESERMISGMKNVESFELQVFERDVGGTRQCRRCGALDLETQPLSPAHDQ